MMNYVLTTLMFLTFGINTVSADSFVQVKGTVSGAEYPKKISLVDVKNGQPVEYASTAVSQGGSFGFLLEPAANKEFYYLYDGKRYFRVALSGTASITVKWTEDGVSFVHPGNAQNEFLQRWNHLDNLLVRRKDEAYGAFFARFDSVKVQANSLLQEIKGQDFAPLASDLLQTDLLYAFVMYLRKNQQNYDSEEQSSAYYKSIMDTFPESTARLLKQPYGLDLMKAYFNYKQTYIFRDRDYGIDEQLKEVHVPELAEAYILGNVPTEKYDDFLEYEAKYLPLLSEEGRKIMRNDVPRPMFKMTAGEKAPNFMYADTEGNLHALSEFRGNYIYVDLWATWCAPCKAEIPYLQKIEQKYKGYNISFVSISIDKNKAKWLQYLKEHELYGLQLWAGNWDMLPKEMNIGSIPRFLLIDPNGNWVSSNADRPSNPALDELLKTLLEKR
ncbi:MAG: TlpA family protein disulfide reductase [Prevotella sp.]|jgi:thiol-disulfide isomerase/thioredoxin